MVTSSVRALTTLLVLLATEYSLLALMSYSVELAGRAEKKTFTATRIASTTAARIKL